MTGSGNSGLPEGILRRHRRQLLTSLAAIAALALATALLYAASIHSFAGDSDGATVILEGQAMSAGHLTLHGWALTLESFWSIDAVLYAVVVGLFGVHPYLLHLVPALIGAAIVVLGACLASHGEHSAAGIAAAAVVVALLGLPSADLAYFFLAGPLHVATALWCLGAFALLTRGHFGAAWVVGVALLAAGLLGDFITVTIGVAPVLLGGLLAMARARNWRAGIELATAAPASALFALALRAAAHFVGTFAVVNRSFPVSASQIAWNLENLPREWSSLLGFGTLPVGIANGPALLQLLHLVAVLLVTGSAVLAVFETAGALLQGVRRQPVTRATAPLDDLLLLALLGGVTTFVLFAPTPDPANARYLTAGVIFAVVLSARRVYVRVARGVDASLGRYLLTGALVFATAFLADLGVYLAKAAPRLPAAQLAAFLQQHRLDLGIGDYWSSSIVTVQSAGEVTVRPITADLVDHLHRYDRQSSASWYAGQAFGYFVYDAAHEIRGVNAAAAVSAFGEPAHTFDVGTYRVLVWDHPVTISPALPPQPNPLDIEW